VHEWTRAGLVIRASLNPGVQFAAVYATSGQRIRYQVRPVANRNIADDSYLATPEQIALHAPIWVRIERKGDQFRAFYSTDARAWTPMVWSPQTVSMPEKVYLGLAVTSHDSKRTAEARFSHVTTTGDVTPTGSFKESQDIRFQLPP
jgi:regulation of enolase protein 1 (concanavalin A-like superfamily)